MFHLLYPNATYTYIHTYAHACLTLGRQTTDRHLFNTYYFYFELNMLK